MCIHEKMYSKDIVLTSLPAKYIWTCTKCGEKGIDTEIIDSSLKEKFREIEIYFQMNK